MTAEVIQFRLRPVPAPAPCQDPLQDYDREMLAAMRSDLIDTARLGGPDYACSEMNPDPGPTAA